MKRLLTALFLTVFLLALFVFLVANREPMMLSMDPFNTEDPALAVGPVPAAVLLVIALAFGFVLGAFAMWLSGAKRRREAKLRRREVRTLQRELKEARGYQPKDNVLVPHGEGGAGAGGGGAVPALRA